jgi:Multiubiquitin
MSEHEEASKDKYDIGVNGTPFDVSNQTVSYEQAVDLAYPNGRSDPSAMFKVDYEDAHSKPKDGELDEGGSVEVEKKGTEFSVIRSIRS